MHLQGHRCVRKIASLILLLSANGIARAQAPTISTKVNVVSVFATVHDRDGKVVKNLTQDDFVLLEDGVPQKIDYFSHESDLPLTVGLLVDTSRSQIGVLDQERRASYAFLDQVLRQQADRAFVVQFDTGVKTLQGLTSTRSDLASALARLAIPPEYATLIYSAIHDSSENIMRQQSGRKAFILLTDGVAFRDPVTMVTAIEFAQRADTIIFPIRFSDPIPVYRPLKAAVMGAAKEHGKEGLHRMANETGGIYSEVKEGHSLESIYAEIEDLLRNQYSIGYTPTHTERDGKFHSIKLTTKERHLVAHARNGYYAQ